MPADERPDDILSFLVGAEHDGAPLTPHHQIGSCFLLLIAGIDTTWSSISAGLWHLATHPDDQDRLRREPELLPSAVEEILRFYSPVTMARYVTADTEFKGCPMHEGDKVLLAFPAGNRDPAIFEDPDAFHIDRALNRHVAFGSGVHRCLGSNLARMELRVALEAFLERIPPFTLDDSADPEWSGGQVRGRAPCVAALVTAGRPLVVGHVASCQPTCIARRPKGNHLRNSFRPPCSSVSRRADRDGSSRTSSMAKNFHGSGRRAAASGCGRRASASWVSV